MSDEAPRWQRARAIRPDRFPARGRHLIEIVHPDLWVECQPPEERTANDANGVNLVTKRYHVTNIWHGRQQIVIEAELLELQGEFAAEATLYDYQTLMARQVPVVRIQEVTVQ